jgi:hypothetical protein
VIELGGPGTNQKATLAGWWLRWPAAGLREQANAPKERKALLPDES